MSICGFKFEKSLQSKKKDILLFSFLKSKKINFQAQGKDKNYIKLIYKKFKKM